MGGGHAVGGGARSGAGALEREGVMGWIGLDWDWFGLVGLVD